MCPAKEIVLKASTWAVLTIVSYRYFSHPKGVTLSHCSELNEAGTCSNWQLSSSHLLL